MRLKGILGSIARVRYYIPLPNFYLVLHGLRCRRSTLIDQSIILIQLSFSLTTHSLISTVDFRIKFSESRFQDPLSVSLSHLSRFIYQITEITVYKHNKFLFLDETTRVRLLEWCQLQIPTCTVSNLSTCWQDGIALCALMESTCPGVCPRYDLLKPQHKVNNCRLGLKLANKHLCIPLVSKPK